MHYAVLPGKEEEFETGFLETLDQLKGVPGHVESHLYEDVAEQGSYVILSEWKSKQDFKAFLTSDAFRRVTAWGQAEILRGRPRHQIFENVSD
jgi:heme-degrading monooxygenase HmoA